MPFTFRPAVRENTPLIIGIAGPTKSGKTYSAHRMARGLAGDKRIVMINAEGARGHQYAEKFSYDACDILPPYAPERSTEALQAASALNPGALILDSASHMHDGPGGLLEQHEEELTRMAGNDYKKRDKCNFAAWIRPKAAENKFIYTMLGLSCPIILCFRAKEKIKIIPGKEPLDLGWQPICGERIGFETIFTLMLPPHSKGVPSEHLSEMREPFGAMVDFKKCVDERLGEQLAEWARGASSEPVTSRAEWLQRIKQAGATLKLSEADRLAKWAQFCGKTTPATVTLAQLASLYATLEADAMKAAV